VWQSGTRAITRRRMKTNTTGLRSTAGVQGEPPPGPRRAAGGK
jgi:hypothetical protein